MTNEELAAIEERNRERRVLKEATTSGPWCYESFGCVMPPRGMMIVVRRNEWWDAQSERYRSAAGIRGALLDGHMDTSDMQPYYDADWIAHAHEDAVEDDIDALTREVRRLRGLLPTLTTTQ